LKNWGRNTGLFVGCKTASPLTSFIGKRSFSLDNPREGFTKTTAIPIGYSGLTLKGNKRVTLIPGDGIGPEVTESVLGIFQAANVPIEWEIFRNLFKNNLTHELNDVVFQELLSSIARNRVCLKGPLYTPIETPSVNVKLRKSLDLYANIVPCANVSGLNTRHKEQAVDLVVVRENTQGEYSGFEQAVEPGVVQSLKITTDRSTRRIAQFAFEYAKRNGREKVTCIHKANIQKQTDGLFLKVCRQVAADYPAIKYNEMIIDNCCMQLVMNPGQFDVMLTPNLYGNIIANVATGLVGGPGIVGGANVGDGIAVFEVGARHVAQDIAGQNKANPVALIQSSIMMLRYLDLPEYAKKIENAVRYVISEQKVWTGDLGGKSSTKDVTQAIIDQLSVP